MINWFAIVYILAMLLAWPIATYIWGRKVRNWGRSFSTGIAVFTGVTTTVLGYLSTEVLRSYFRGEGFSIGALFPFIWMATPFLILIVILLVARKKEGLRNSTDGR